MATKDMLTAFIVLALYSFAVLQKAASTTPSTGGAQTARSQTCHNDGDCGAGHGCPQSVPSGAGRHCFQLGSAAAFEFCYEQRQCRTGLICQSGDFQFKPDPANKKGNSLCRPQQPKESSFKSDKNVKKGAGRGRFRKTF